MDHLHESTPAPEPQGPALGFEPAAPTAPGTQGLSESSSATAGPSTEEYVEVLKDVIDPELGINVVDLGLLYGVRWDEDDALVLEMTLTTAACPLQDVIEEQVEQTLSPLVDQWRIDWVWMPPWGPARITEEGREQMRALGFNI